jgi:hypothetical protein
LVINDEEFSFLEDQKMSEQLWYVYNQQQQLGPFEARQIIQLLDNSMISKEAYVFKVGWKDWRPIEETLDLLGGENKSEAPSAPIAETDSLKRRLGAPRATISGRVIVHNNGQLVIGSGINISSSGIFIETTDQIFKLGEKLKVTVKVDGFSKQFNTVADVIRLNSDPKNPVGYGLRFIGLDVDIGNRIQQLVDESNNNEETDQQQAAN